MQIELELNRAWIYDDGEIIGETNFVIRNTDVHKIEKALQIKMNNDFLDIYEPETDGEKIYQYTKKKNLLVEDLGIQMY